MDDYHPAPSSPQPSSSSESDNDENDPSTVPLPQPPRPKKKKKKLRKSNSSISLDSLERDDLADDIPVNHTTQPPPSSLTQPLGAQRNQVPQLGTNIQQQQTGVNALPPKKSPVEQPQRVVKQPAQQPSRDTSQLPESGASVATTPDMEPDEPLTDDNLVNIAALSTTDDFGWDRFIFFSHRSQRHFFPENSYLSQFSPFTSVASSIAGLTTRSVCAVCGAGGTLHDCMRCPLTFHATCIDPLKTTKLGKGWMCPACRSAKNGDTGPDWYPAPNVPLRPLPDPSTGIKRLLADVREGNPLDMVFSPNLLSYYRSIAGTDWLRCSRCRRIRTVTEGVLSEAVRIPFECALAFWIDISERRCDPPGEQKLYGKGEQRVVQYLRSRKTQRQFLFRFAFGEVDAVDFGKADMQNLPKLQPLKAAQPQMKLPTLTPMDISPPPPPKALPQQPSQAQRPQPATQPKVTLPRQVITPPRQVITPPRQAILPQRQVVPPPRQVLTPVRQIIPPAAQQVQPMVVSASSTPQGSSQISGQSVVPVQAPVQVPLNQTMQVSPASLTPAAQPPSVAVTKSEPMENDQNNQEDLLQFIAQLEWDESVLDELTDLALANDKKLSQLYGAFHTTPPKFQRQAIRLVNRMKGGSQSHQTQTTPPAQTVTTPQRVQPQVQPQVQAQLRPQARPQVQALEALAPQLQQQLQQMQAQMQMAAQQPAQQAAVQVTQRQVPAPGRLPQSTIDAMFRQMMIKHVRERQELDQKFMRTMEQVPVSQVAEVMNMKDAHVAKLKGKQQQETAMFYQTHGMLS